jgi:hypothetical protein
MIISLSIETKIREFQFKLLHNILYTNKQLHRMNPKRFTSPNCTFCDEQEETYEHLFYKCKIVVALWREILILLGRPLELSEPPSKLCMILGDPEINGQINFFCLVVRKHIYYSKLENKIPNVTQFFHLLRRIYHTELIIAQKQNKEICHYSKWSSLIPYMS